MCTNAGHPNIFGSNEEMNFIDDKSAEGHDKEFKEFEI